MEYYTVLPVRFGTVAASEDDVRLGLLRRRQFGSLHVGCSSAWTTRSNLASRRRTNRERIFAKLLEDDPELRLLRDTLANRSETETRYERIQLLGRWWSRRWPHAASRDAKQVIEVLRPLAVET